MGRGLFFRKGKGESAFKNKNKQKNRKKYEQNLNKRFSYDKMRIRDILVFRNENQKEKGEPA